MVQARQKDQLQIVTDIIVQAINPEKIFLLGVSPVGGPIQNIFMEPMAIQRPVKDLTNYYLLILTRREDKRKFHELHEFIESRMRLTTTVTIIIEGLHVFNEWLAIGHAFARRVYASGLLIYDGGASLCIPKEVDVSQERTIFKEEFDFWYKKITEYLAGADLFSIRKEFGLSAFFLHQAMEHGLTILIKSITGYRLTTHNLQKLMGFSSPFSAELAALFPRNTDEENYLFQLLQRGYIEGRYKNDFIITEEEIDSLTVRVKKLRDIIKSMMENLMNDNYRGDIDENELSKIKS